jgi:hypothetical protein
MESDSSLPHSQVHATCPYPETEQNSLCLHIPLLEVNVTIIFLSTPRSSKWLLSSEIFHQPYMHQSCPPQVPQTPPIACETWKDILKIVDMEGREQWGKTNAHK